MSFIDRSNFHLCVLSLWVDNDVSMHKVVGLVVLIPTSPRSSKSESGRKRYHCFCKHVFLLARLLVDRPPHRPVRRQARSDRVSHQVAQQPPALALVPTGASTEPARFSPGGMPGGRRLAQQVSRSDRPSHRPARCHNRCAGLPTGMPETSQIWPQTVIFLLAIKGASSPTVF